MDAVVVFDNVLVPWERVFLCGDVARCNALYAGTGAVVHMMHQVAVKNVAKSEFVLQVLAVRIAEASDAMSLPHVRERLAEMIMTTETMRARSCVPRKLTRPPSKRACSTPWRARRSTPRTLSRACIRASSKLSSETRIRPDGDAVRRRFRQSRRTARHRALLRRRRRSGEERVALYRLAWEVACSAFGGRQVLYERFFFGDPVRMASALVDNTDLKPLSDRVRAFLKRPD